MGFTCFCGVWAEIEWIDDAAILLFWVGPLQNAGQHHLMPLSDLNASVKCPLTLLELQDRPASRALFRVLAMRWDTCLFSRYILDRTSEILTGLDKSEKSGLKLVSKIVPGWP